MPEGPTLVVLAAGLGSRYGGQKQLESLGPDGSTLMDYSVYDAWRAGFARAVFVIRPDIADAFDSRVKDRYRKRLAVETAFQRLDALPEGFTVPWGRTKPWGTTQALLAARGYLAGPFAVVNADDFYGAEALAAAGGFLERTGADPDRHAVVGYRLDATASPAGGVSRAILERRADGTLASVVEAVDLIAGDDGWFTGRTAGAVRRFPPDTPVSMNLWALKPSILSSFERGFVRFLEANPDPSAEYYLPDAVGDALEATGARVDVLPSAGRWCGVTHPGDRDRVKAFLADQVRSRAYPEPLWP